MNKNLLLIFTSLCVFSFNTTEGQAVLFNDSGGVAEFANGESGGQCEAEDYYNKLALSESGNCGGAGGYNCVNGIGAMGRYQFMPKTLRGMGINPSSFLGNQELQEQAIRSFTSANDACLQRNGAYNYIGQVRNGVTITKSGLLGAAHLGGCGGATKFAKSGYNPNDGHTSLSQYAAKFGGYNMFGSGTTGECGKGDPLAAQQFAQNQAAGIAGLIGCDPAIHKGATKKKEALQQMETEAAKALITKPTSVQQLTCFDQYAKLNADKIGKIHSDPKKGISKTVTPNVEQPNMQHVIKNFMTGVLSGGLQSMLKNSLGSLMGGLTGGATGGGTSSCGAMDQMWKLLQCIDFPKMPSLSDIMGGGGAGKLGGILSSLGGAGGLGSLGSGAGGGGIMGAVCQAMKGAMGGGGSGGTDAFENLADELDNDYDNTCDYDTVAMETSNMDADLNGDLFISEAEALLIDTTYGNGDCDLTDNEIDDAVQGETSSSSSSQCVYADILSTVTNTDADLNSDNVITASEIQTIDTTYGNSDCIIDDTEIQNAVDGLSANDTSSGGQN